MDPGSPLLAAASAAGWRLSRPVRGLLRDLDAQLSRRARPRVAVLAVGSRVGEPGGLAGLLAARPGARVTTVDASLDASHQHAELAARGRFDLIVLDLGVTVPGRTAADLGIDRLQDVFFHLRRSGAAVVRLPSGAGAPVSAAQRWAVLAGFLDLLRGAADPPTSADQPGAQRLSGTTEARARFDRRMLSEAIGRVVLAHQHLLAVNQEPALAKMREDEMDLVLALRSGRSGRVLERVPGGRFRSSGLRRESSPSGAELQDTRLDAPSVSLREYASVTCLPQQVAVQRNLLLPDTYRKNQAPRLQHTRTHEAGERFARPIDRSAPRPLAGTYFYLDSEFPGHFGHVMTEQMSRLWAWRRAKQLYPDLRALVSRRTGRGLATHEREIFAAAGLHGEDIVVVHSPVRVERLLAATPMFSGPDYAHPGIAALWKEVGDVLVSSAPRRDYPDRVFCSRRGQRRPCHNAADVEAVFAGHGFAVVRPESLPFVEQAAMFREADVIAGFAGSGLLGLVFSGGPKRVVVVSSESYTARNEHLVCAVLDHELDVLWSRPDRAQPADGWDQEAFRSGFTFDFEREGRHLEQVLASLS